MFLTVSFCAYSAVRRSTLHSLGDLVLCHATKKKKNDLIIIPEAYRLSHWPKSALLVHYHMNVLV